GVSLLSSAWGQVGPPRYRRQANSVSFQPSYVAYALAQPSEPISEQADYRSYESFITHKTPSVL
ncbi:hypothetical protein, partial [Pectobacterium punjabense]|uniref:hypothetical protein n=1 Tax=Pectobacterium punjabense TaxID=2108399 RepID=UPI002B2407CA